MTNKISTYNKLPREKYPGRHILLVLNDLHPSPRLEHDDHVRLVKDVAGGVDSHTLKVLYLLRISVKVDVSSIHDHIQSVSPLSIGLSHSDLNCRWKVVFRCHRWESSGINCAVRTVIHLNRYKCQLSLHKDPKTTCSNLPWTSSLTLGVLALTKTYSPRPLNVYAWLSNVYTWGSPKTVAEG